MGIPIWTSEVGGVWAHLRGRGGVWAHLRAVLEGEGVLRAKLAFHTYRYILYVLWFIRRPLAFECGRGG